VRQLNKAAHSGSQAIDGLEKRRGHAVFWHIEMMDQLKEKIKLLKKISAAVGGELTPEQVEQILKALEAKKELEKLKQKQVKKED
jgi:hypothetical protein